MYGSAQLSLQTCMVRRSGALAEAASEARHPDASRRARRGSSGMRRRRAGVLVVSQ